MQRRVLFCFPGREWPSGTLGSRKMGGGGQGHVLYDLSRGARSTCSSCPRVRRPADPLGSHSQPHPLRIKGKQVRPRLSPPAANPHPLRLGLPPPTLGSRLPAPPRPPAEPETTSLLATRPRGPRGQRLGQELQPPPQCPRAPPSPRAPPLPESPLLEPPLTQEPRPAAAGPRQPRGSPPPRDPSAPYFRLPPAPANSYLPLLG